MPPCGECKGWKGIQVGIQEFDGASKALAGKNSKASEGFSIAADGLKDFYTSNTGKPWELPYFAPGAGGCSGCGSAGCRPSGVCNSAPSSKCGSGGGGGSCGGSGAPSLFSGGFGGIGAAKSRADSFNPLAKSGNRWGP